jgi:hypothetical protein
LSTKVKMNSLTVGNRLSGHFSRYNVSAPQ